MFPFSTSLSLEIHSCILTITARTSTRYQISSFALFYPTVLPQVGSTLFAKLAAFLIVERMGILAISRSTVLLCSLPVLGRKSRHLDSSLTTLDSNHRIREEFLVAIFLLLDPVHHIRISRFKSCTILARAIASEIPDLPMAL